MGITQHESHRTLAVFDNMLRQFNALPHPVGMLGKFTRKWKQHTDDELRGRIFATMLTLVRACVLLALSVFRGVPVKPETEITPQVLPFEERMDSPEARWDAADDLGASASASETVRGKKILNTVPSPGSL